MLLSIIYSLGISQAILLAYFLYCSRLTLWQGNLYLSQFLSCIACILSLFLARIHLGNAIPAVIFWPIVALPALFGPLLYFYIQSLNSRTTAIVKKRGTRAFSAVHRFDNTLCSSNYHIAIWWYYSYRWRQCSSKNSHSFICKISFNYFLSCCEFASYFPRRLQTGCF